MLSRRRTTKLVLGAVVLLVATVVGLESFDSGRVFLVRSYVRGERAWAKYFPFDRGRMFVRRLDPLMIRIGVLRPVRIEIQPGVSLLLDPLDDVSRTTLVSLENRWDPEVWDELSSSLTEGSVYLDAGAHIGYESLRAGLIVGKTGQVVAFEPNPNTVEILKANIAASHASNVIVQAIACTDKDQMLTLFDATLGGNSGASSLSESNAGAKARSYTVRGRPIDDVVAELGLKRVDVVKVDVEGAELIVIRGAAETLKRFRPKLIVEVLPRLLGNMGTSVEELESFVKSLGYNVIRSVDYKNKVYTFQ